MLDMSLPGLAQRRRGSPAVPPGPSAPISAVSADGWSATYPDPPGAFAPDASPVRVAVQRSGFDAAGAATMTAEHLVVTARVRQPYPHQAQLTADRIALSDYVYSTDTIAGVANGSAEASPKPVANWIMPHRLVVGNVVRLELIAAHRNARAGRQVAAVKFIATDGTNTVSQTVAATVISGRAGDRNPVVCFQADLDIMGLAAGLIICNAEVYPWIGGAASVNKSAENIVAQAGGLVGREFSPRYFLKNTVLMTSPPFAYVSRAGNDASGVASTNAAAAAASPFLTVLGAFNAIHNALAASTGVDGAIIRIGDDGGTPFVLGSTTATRTQKVAALTIERDPAVPRANARVSFGAAAFRPRLGGSLAAPLTTGALRFRDISIVRTGALTLSGETAAQLEIIFEDVDWDNGGHNASWLNQAHDYHLGTTFTNLTGNSSLGAGTFEHRLLRGISADMTYGTIEGWLTVGSSITRPGTFARGSRLFSGAIWAYNRLRDPIATVVMLALGASADVNGAAILQNLVEYTSAAQAAALRISGDSDTGSNTHVVIHNNTFAGFFINGRGNLFYEDGTTPRTSRLHSLKGNIHVQINTKGDVFVADGARTGNWAYLHGVGCEGEFSQYVDADSGGIGSSFAQAYPGIGAKIGLSATVRNDPLFADYRGTTAGPSAGAGGGDYRIGAASPAKGMVTGAVLSHDLAGEARPATGDSAGAYR